MMKSKQSRDAGRACLTAREPPLPDLLAIGATPSNDGVVRLRGVDGISFFAAAVDIGDAGTLEVSADDAGRGLPLTLRWSPLVGSHSRLDPVKVWLDLLVAARSLVAAGARVGRWRVRCAGLRGSSRSHSVRAA